MVPATRLPGSEVLRSAEQVPLRRLSVSEERDDSDDETDEERGSSDELKLLRDESARSTLKLPPVDRGAGAWRFVLGVFVLEALLWGFPLAFGIFQAHYSKHALFVSSAKHVPLIGALATGLTYLLVNLVTPICLRFPSYQRFTIILGWALCMSGLVIASFATTVWHLILGQGIMYGLGWVVCGTPCMLMLNEWFVARRGLAYGILFGASGISGLIIPFVLENLLAKYDFRITLRVYSAAILLLSGPGLLLVKPRTPLHLQTPEDTSFSRSHGFLRWGMTYLFFAAVLLQGLAFFLPNMFLPSFVVDLALDPWWGDLILSVNSLSQVTGQLLLGHYSDIWSVRLPSSVAALISGVAVLAIWGPAKNAWQLLVFAVFWGGFAGSYSVLWTRIASALAQSPGETMILYGWFSFERGVASGLAGPISAALLSDEIEMDAYGLGRYRGITLFTGVTLLLSASTVLGLCFIQYPPAVREGRKANGVTADED